MNGRYVIHFLFSFFAKYIYIYIYIQNRVYQGLPYSMANEAC